MESLLFWSKTFPATVGDKPRDAEFPWSQTAPRHRAPIAVLVPGAKEPLQQQQQLPAAPSPARALPRGSRPFPCWGRAAAAAALGPGGGCGAGGEAQPGACLPGGERRGRSRRAEPSRAARPGWRRLLALLAAPRMLPGGPRWALLLLGSLLLLGAARGAEGE